MIKILKNVLVIAFLALVVGCPTTSTQFTPKTIVNSHFNDYKQMDKDGKGDNENVAAILKVFVTDMISVPAESWSNVQVRADIYLEGLITNSISINYTLMATEGEIDITESLIDDSIRYYIKQNDFSQMAGNLISDHIATPFIWRINRYEYDIP